VKAGVFMDVLTLDWGVFSLAMDSWAFSGELVCLPLIGGRETILRAFCSQLYGRSVRPGISSSGCRNAVYNSSGCRHHSAFHGRKEYSLICLRSPDPTN
jgi:hypothetical protein